MRSEPILHRQRLIDLLRDRYLLDVERLEFVPYGLDSWSYVAVCRDGGRAFVKLARQDRLEGTAPPGSELALLAALSDLGRVSVPRPLPDRDGDFIDRVDGFEVHILEFLDGRNLADEEDWPDDLYARVAETVAAVHASTPDVRQLVQRVERYELPFLPVLGAAVRGLVAGEAFPAAGDPALAVLRTRLVPRAVELEMAMARLEQLRERARTRVADDVLCHTDIWGSNLLLADDGRVHLLDWNGALVGPPECDLFMFAGTSFFPAERFGWFLHRYEAAFRPVRLDADVLGFYLYRRHLEDLADFVPSIALGRTDAASPTETLGFVAAILDELPLVEGRIRRIQALLDARAG
jgi:spectinomycin phosphotransferase